MTLFELWPWYGAFKYKPIEWSKIKWNGYDGRRPVPILFNTVDHYYLSYLEFFSNYSWNRRTFELFFNHPLKPPHITYYSLDIVLTSHDLTRVSEYDSPFLIIDVQRNPYTKDSKNKYLKQGKTLYTVVETEKKFQNCKKLPFDTECIRIECIFDPFEQKAHFMTPQGIDYTQHLNISHDESEGSQKPFYFHIFLNLGPNINYYLTTKINQLMIVDEFPRLQNLILHQHFFHKPRTLHQLLVKHFWLQFTYNDMKTLFALCMINVSYYDFAHWYISGPYIESWPTSASFYQPFHLHLLILCSVLVERFDFDLTNDDQILETFDAIVTTLTVYQLWCSSAMMRPFFPGRDSTNREFCPFDYFYTPYGTLRENQIPIKEANYNVLKAMELSTYYHVATPLIKDYLCSFVDLDKRRKQFLTQHPQTNIIRPQVQPIPRETLIANNTFLLKYVEESLLRVKKTPLSPFILQ